MNDAELIKHLGGPAKVARLLKFEMPGGIQRVQNWLTRGIPPGVKLDFPHIFLKSSRGSSRRARSNRADAKTSQASKGA